LIYLSGVYSLILSQYRAEFGYMLNAIQPTGGEIEATQYPWMLDNGAFSGKWREDIWHKRLEKLAAHNDNCIAAVVPDVVHDAQATLDRWYDYAPFVKSLGYKAAFATQDGCTVEMIPWSEVDVLFVGGSDEHKRIKSWPLIDEAKHRGMWVHVGRVNSPAGIMRFCRADSVDGTHFTYNATRYEQERFIWAVKRCNARCRQEPLFMLD
jgi:hypothetical protein